ncbi:MAG TPA: hypothetical protein DCR65_06555 [Gammaproteobacteria bacterium]|jgi:hypothetical protein|nr:hypothetical protein [Gammaproteobacteria bacterium]
MTLDELTAQLARGAAPALEIHGLDPVLYTAFAVLGGVPQALCDRRGKPLNYRSRYAAQRALAATGAREATFIHRSAYGEMVGLDDVGNETELRERVILRQE